MNANDALNLLLMHLAETTVERDQARAQLATEVAALQAQIAELKAASASKPASPKRRGGAR